MTAAAAKARSKTSLFLECRRRAPDFALAWARNAAGNPEARATFTAGGLHYVIAHTPAAPSVDAELTVLHGALDALELFGKEPTR